MQGCMRDSILRYYPPPGRRLQDRGADRAWRTGRARARGWARGRPRALRSGGRGRSARCACARTSTPRGRGPRLLPAPRQRGARRRQQNNVRDRRGGGSEPRVCVWDAPAAGGSRSRRGWRPVGGTPGASRRAPSARAPSACTCSAPRRFARGSGWPAGPASPARGDRRSTHCNLIVYQVPMLRVPYHYANLVRLWSEKNEQKKSHMRL